MWSDRAASAATLSYFRWVHGGEKGRDDWRNVSQARREAELAAMHAIHTRERNRTLALARAQPWRVLVLPWERGGGLRNDTEEALSRFLLGEQCASSRGLLQSRPTKYACSRLEPRTT